MADVTDLDTLQAGTEPDDRNGSARSDVPKPRVVEQDLQEQILRLLPRLQRYARVLTRDVSAADDLVQDCLARALGKIHLWEPGTDLRAWLFTILHHQHVSRTRRDARQRASLEWQESHVSSALSPSQTARLELRDLERALAKLPEEQRSAILLVGLEGMGYVEAASVANTPVGTARSRVARGREALRAMTGLFPVRHTGRREKPADLRSSPRRSPQKAISATLPRHAIQ
jgi:RNA polymerase sigma-70 factor (ECF subfamily)